MLDCRSLVGTGRRGVNCLVLFFSNRLGHHLIQVVKWFSLVKWFSWDSYKAVSEFCISGAAGASPARSPL